MAGGFGILVLERAAHDRLFWPAIDSASVQQATVLAYRTADDAAIAIETQRRKCGLCEDSKPAPLPDGLWGVWLPSRGSEASSCGQWLEPFDDDGVPAAVLFETREAAQRTLEILQGRTDARITWDAVVKPFAWDDVPIPQNGNREVTR